METLANVRTVVFDKTGTLTRGNFAVTKICPAMADGSAAAALWTASENAEDVAAQAENSSPAPSKDLQAAADRLLEYAALAESYSSHPISRSLKEAYGERLAAQAARVGDAEEISGKGVITEVDGRRIGAGNLQLMQDLGVLITEENDHSDV